MLPARFSQRKEKELKMSGAVENTEQNETGKSHQKGALTGILAVGGLLGALAASSCCILPLVLFSLGISGAWIGNLTALSQYHGIFVAATLCLLGAAYWQVYRKKRGESCCVADSYCASPSSGRVMKVVLWGATLLITTALLFPYLTPYFLSE